MNYYTPQRFIYKYCQSYHYQIDFISTDIFLCKTCHFRWRKKKSATITVMVYYITFLNDSFIAVVSHITDYLEIVYELKINFISTQLYIHNFHYIVKFIYFFIKFWFSFPWLFVNSFQSFWNSLINSNLCPRSFFSKANYKDLYYRKEIIPKLSLANPYFWFLQAIYHRALFINNLQY